MNEENTSSQSRGGEDIAGRMVKEAGRRYRDIPKGEDVKRVTFEKLFEGRIDKENYIYAVLAGFILGMLLSLIPLIGLLAGLALAVLGGGVMARRFRDINKSGWFALILLIPVVGLVAVVYLMLTDAVDEGNTYGQKPDPKRGFYHAILNI